MATPTEATPTEAGTCAYCGKRRATLRLKTVGYKGAGDPYAHESCYIASAGPPRATREELRRALALARMTLEHSEFWNNANARAKTVAAIRKALGDE